MIDPNTNPDMGLLKIGVLGWIIVWQSILLERVLVSVLLSPSFDYGNHPITKEFWQRFSGYDLSDDCPLVQVTPTFNQSPELGAEQ